MTKDPICGMTVDEATALSAERDGETFYFCSEHCRKKFLGQIPPPPVAPETEHEGHAHHGHEHAAVKPSTAAKYFCPMCPGIESDKPGACPKCGMALERNPSWKSAAKTVYTCPMHPEVRQDHPGTCPKCGMALEPLTTSGDDEPEEDTELPEMTRRFVWSAALTQPVFLSAMAHLVPAWSHSEWA